MTFRIEASLKLQYKARVEVRCSRIRKFTRRLMNQGSFVEELVVVYDGVDY